MKLNDKIKKLKVSYGNLIKDIQYDAKKRVVQVVLVGSLAPALVLASACTEEELLQAQHTIEQMTDNPDVIDTPDVVVEPPSVEPVVDDPVVEPEVVEPEEINPRDYAAVYDFDFEVPVYTEEEVEAARERLEENQELLDEIGDDYERLATEYATAAQDYYIANQDIIYYIYNCCKDADFKKACQTENGGKDQRRYYDVNSGFYYLIQNNSLMVIGEINNCYVNLAIWNSTVGDISIGEISVNSGLIQIGPGSYAQFGSEKENKRLYEMVKETTLEYDISMLTDEEFNEAGFKYIEKETVLSLTK